MKQKTQNLRWIGASGYEFEKHPDGHIIGVHRLEYEKHHGPIPEGWHVHHRDEDKLNNHPSNLEALPWPEHKRRHEGHWQDEQGNWWKSCRDCGSDLPEEEFPTKRYVDGIRKTRGNCKTCERDRQRMKNGWQGGKQKTFGQYFGPRSNISIS